MHHSMTLTQIEGQIQGHDGPKVAKMADFKFKVYLFRWYAYNQKTN